MTETTHVLLVANRTADTDALLRAVAERAANGTKSFHLLMPAVPSGLHRVVDPGGLRSEQRLPVEGAAQVPVRGVEEAHVPPRCRVERTEPDTGGESDL